MSDTLQVLCPDGKHRSFHKGHLTSIADPSSTDGPVRAWSGFVYASKKRVYGNVVVDTICFLPHGNNAALVSGEFPQNEAIDHAVDAVAADALIDAVDPDPEQWEIEAEEQFQLAAAVD